MERRSAASGNSLVAGVIHIELVEHESSFSNHNHITIMKNAGMAGDGNRIHRRAMFTADISDRHNIVRVRNQTMLPTNTLVLHKTDVAIEGASDSKRRVLANRVGNILAGDERVHLVILDFSTVCSNA